MQASGSNLIERYGRESLGLSEVSATMVERKLARTATVQWRKYLLEMLSLCSELEGCASRIGKGMAWPDSPSWPLQPVKFKYCDQNWYDAIVAGVMSNGALIVEISVQPWLGLNLVAYPENVRIRDASIDASIWFQLD